MSEAVVEDAERLMAEGRDAAAAGAVREEAAAQLAMPMAAAAPMAPAADAPADAIPMTSNSDAASTVDGRFKLSHFSGYDPTDGAMGGGAGTEALGKAAGELGEASKDIKVYAKRSESRAVLGRKGGANQKAEAEQAPSRQRFVETAYWNPAVVTGKDGIGKVTFKAPLALSEYRFTARGVTGSDTLVGQSTADLAVRKDFFVDLKTPAALDRGRQAPLRRPVAPRGRRRQGRRSA